MSFTELSSITGAMLLSFGGGAAIVFALSRWLGGVWAKRIIESERAHETREYELLIRRRDVYAKLAVAMRIFLSASTQSDAESQKAFLSAYDEAALWAPDSVMNPVGALLDKIRSNTEKRGTVSESELQTSYASCISAMREDCGHPNSRFVFRMVTF